MTSFSGVWQTISLSPAGSTVQYTGFPALPLFSFSEADDDVSFIFRLSFRNQTLFTGAGNDSIFIQSVALTLLAQGFSIDLGTGDDSLTVANWDFAAAPYPVQILGGAGNDDISLSGLFTYSADLTVDLGPGTGLQTLDLQGLTFSYPITVHVVGGGDADVLKLAGRPADYGLIDVIGTDISPPAAGSLSRLGITYSFSGIELIKFQSPNNRPPTAVSDEVVALQNTDLTSVTVGGQTIPLAQYLLSNDSDPDGESLSITGISEVSDGIDVSLDSDGTVVVSPNEDFVGPASFTYSISDGNGGTASALVNVTVNAVPGITRPGTNGVDNILGTVGKDNLSGGNGNDIINGGRGADSINGGNGDDILIGGRGNDIVTGGVGADTFVLAPGEGTDTFTDFKPGTDKIGLSGGLNFFSLDLRDTNKIKTTGGELLATLQGVTASTLTASSFISYTG